MSDIKITVGGAIEDEASRRWRLLKINVREARQHNAHRSPDEIDAAISQALDEVRSDRRKSLHDNS